MPNVRFYLPSSIVHLVLLCTCACDRDASRLPAPVTLERPTDALRTRAAAISLRFDNGRSEPGNPVQGQDRLQVAAVFADIDRRDVGLLSGLAGQSGSGARIDDLDVCVRQPDGGRPLGSSSDTRPHSWMQLLDVGNLELLSGQRRAPLRVQLVPAVIESARGVRYDLALEQARSWLAAGRLTVRSTGGDGVAAFEATVDVPRPVRITHVGQLPAQQGVVDGLAPDEVLRLRWGSVDGTAETELMVGSEEPGTLGWLRCRVRDDGEFSVPSALTAQLPARTQRRPWLIVLVRRSYAKVIGFDDRPMRLELADSVHVR